MRLLEVADAHATKKDFVNALPVYQQCLPIVEAAPPSSSKALILLEIGRCYMFLGDYSNALASMRSASEDTNATTTTRCRSSALMCYALYHVSSPDTERQCHQTLKLLDDVRAAGHSLADGFDYADIRASVHATLGEVYRAAIRPFESLEQFSAAVSVYEELGNVAALSCSLTGMSNCYSLQGRVDKALETAERAISIGGETTVTLDCLAGALRGASRPDEALRAYRKSLALSIRTCGRRSVTTAVSQTRIGDCLLSLERFDDALESFYSARGILEELHSNDLEYAEVLYRICPLISNRPSEALGLIERALAIYRRTYSEDNMIISRCLRLLAEVNSALGNVDAAERAVFESAIAARRSQVQCAAAGCPRKMKADGSPLEMCAGCRRTHYCSVDCQRADWKAVHKAECKHLQQLQKLQQVSAGGAPGQPSSPSH